MDSSTKRLFVGGLYDNIAESELRGRFSKFGDVDKIEIKTKKSSDGVAEKTFAYLDVNITDENLKKCFSVLNRSRWKGNELKIQLAKADFMKRLKEERENNFEKTPKPKKKKVDFQDPLDGVAGVDNFHMKGAVPGTPVGAEEKNWVVGKYGRVLPIVNIRRRDKRKMMKVDPSKFCHNSKRMKEETIEVSDTGVHDLTWSIDTKDSEMIKRRKGEFPSWKPKKKKRSSDVDMQSLADFYESFRTGSTSKNTDFEVVPDNYLKVSQTRTYFSEENDSSGEDFENHKTSTPFPSPFPQLHQKADVKTGGKDQSVKGKNDNVEKTKKLEDPKCTPIAKQLGKGQKDISKKILESTEHSKSSSALEKSATQDTKPNSLSSISQNTAAAECVSDKQSNSPKKSKTQAKDDQLCNQFNSKSNSKEKDSNDSINKFSNKKSDSSDFNKGNKSVTKKPKLQAFGGTRHLYDNPSSNTQQKGEPKLLKDTADSTPSSLANKASSASQGNSASSVSLVDSGSLASSSHSAPAEPPSEAMCGVKRTLFQNSMLKHSQEKENAQEDSDGDSVSSADTDVIISSAKKHRGEGTVMGYGSMETPVSLQNSLNYSISEFGGGLVDGESSGQASWMDRWNYDLDDSNDSNDFEKVARKILKNQKETRNSGANNVLVNNDGEVKKKIVSSAEPHNSKKSDSNISSDEEEEDEEEEEEDDNDNEEETTSDSDDDDENSSSNKNIKQRNVKSKMRDSKKKDSDDESDDKSSSDESDEDENGKKSDVEERSGESNDEDSGEESDDEESSEESDDENSGSSLEENKGIAEVKKSTKESEKVKKYLSVTSKAGKDENADKVLQHSNEKPAAQERKGKDKAEQERLSKEANRKKQEALRLKQEEYNTRKSIIKQALSGVDNAKRSNRIVFDSDSDDDATHKSAPQQPNKKAWDLEDSDDGDESEEDSEDESEEDSSAEEKDDKNKAGDITTANEKVTKSLFDESSSDGGDNDDEDAFMTKPQFEGEAGSELMKLQMKFNTDSRFKLDQRFAESDEEKDDKEGNVEEVEDEKTRNLKVLQEVVGVPINVVTDKKDRMKKLFKDISALQYDPSREDHKNFEIQPTPDQKKKEGKKKKSKKQKADEEEAEAESLPVVSGEKFYEVDTSALEEAFKKPDDTSNTSTGAFSLLAAFGKKTEDDDEDEGMQEETTDPTPKWQGFNFHNSSDDEDLGNESDEEKHTEGEEAKKEETPIFVAKSKDSFFFTEDDERIKEGITSFCRQEDLEKIRERWQEKRPDLIKAYHAKYKRAVRNKRALEKKKTPTKRK